MLYGKWTQRQKDILVDSGGTGLNIRQIAGRPDLDPTLKKKPDPDYSRINPYPTKINFTFICTNHRRLYSVLQSYKENLIILLPL